MNNLLTRTNRIRFEQRLFGFIQIYHLTYNLLSYTYTFIHYPPAGIFYYTPARMPAEKSVMQMIIASATYDSTPSSKWRAIIIVVVAVLLGVCLWWIVCTRDKCKFDENTAVVTAGRLSYPVISRVYRRDNDTHLFVRRGRSVCCCTVDVFPESHKILYPFHTGIIQYNIIMECKY